MEPVKEIGEKRKAEEKKEHNAKQRKNEVNLNTQKEKMNDDIKGKIRESKEKALEAERAFQTEVHIEWPMQRECTTFNLCTAFIRLITKMGNVDPSIYVKSE
eukprot:468486-Ditylum_brightwellii.AAC.1